MQHLLHTAGNWIGGYAVTIALCSMLSGLMYMPFVAIYAASVKIPLHPGLSIGLALSVTTMLVHGSYMGGFMRIGIPALNNAFRFLNLRLKYAGGSLLITAESDDELLRINRILNRISFDSARMALFCILFIGYGTWIICLIGELYTFEDGLHIATLATIMTVLHPLFTFIFSEITAGRAVAEVRQKLQQRGLVAEPAPKLHSIRIKQGLIFLLFLIALYTFGVTLYYNAGETYVLIGYSAYLLFAVSLVGYLIFHRIRSSLEEIREAAQLLQRGEHAIVSSRSLDIEFKDLADGLNAATQSLFDYQMNLEQKVKQRTTELSAEKEKSDKLLRNILPDEIAEELKASGRAEPKYYAEASVMFTDFVGFTKIAERLTPADLIAELDRCFSYFDQVTARHHLEKLKTIGDAYMCVAGAPVASACHALDAALAALEIRSFMADQRRLAEEQQLPYWELRLGIHSGPIIAGVIGEKKFAYDIWGDTVNTASRMESSGIAGRINISEATYREVADFFECEFRGQVAAKNKGEVAMYYLLRLKPEFSEDAGGLWPNGSFREAYIKRQGR